MAVVVDQGVWGGLQMESAGTLKEENNEGVDGGMAPSSCASCTPSLVQQGTIVPASSIDVQERIVIYSDHLRQSRNKAVPCFNSTGSSTWSKDTDSKVEQVPQVCSYCSVLLTV